MKTTVMINGTAIALTSIIRCAQPEAGPLGRFHPWQWVEPSDYRAAQAAVETYWQEKRRQKDGTQMFLGDLVEIRSGNYLWLYHWMRTGICGATSSPGLADSRIRGEGDYGRTKEKRP